MLKRLLFALLVITAFSANKALAQTGSIKATVIDAATGETIPFAAVIVESKGSQIGSAVTDINGECIIKPIAAGKYSVKGVIIGYQGVEISGVSVMTDKTAYVEVRMNPSRVEIKTFEKIVYKEPLIDPDTKSGGVVTRAEFNRMATKNVNSIASQTAGVYQADEGSAISVRGSRKSNDGEGSTKTFIDGVRVTGSANIPQQSIEEVAVVTGGLPAEYGDATGGVINITTRGAQTTYFGGIEAISSQVTDAYDYNFLGFSVGGPIIAKKDTTTGSKVGVLGFILGGEISTVRDDDPSAVGMYKVKDDVLSQLEQNPLRPGTGGQALRNTEFINKNDLEKIKAKQNVRSTNYRFNGKLDFSPTKNLNITFGGSVDNTNNHAYIYEYALFNPSNNPQQIDKTWRTYARITQKFGNGDVNKEEKSASVLKSSYYTLQASYAKVLSTTQDDTHGDKIWDYGYVGRFDIYQERSFDTDPSKDTVLNLTGIRQNGFKDTLYVFTPDTTKNPLTARYTSQVFEFAESNGETFSGDLNNIRNSGGLLNGDRPADIYNMWYNTGRQYGGYSKSEKDQVRFTAVFASDIQNHQIKLGFEYEQRTERAFDIAPISLWNSARISANRHLTELDPESGIPIYDINGVFQDTILYSTKFNEESETTFAKNLRKKLGVADDQFVNVDALSPDDLSLDMFSPDELNDLQVGTYYGYDYTGNKIKTKSTFDDFFTGKDADGQLTRNIAAFNPIYMAGYLQDNFDFKDIKFNVGVRVDRFDANQKVLKDPYLLYAAKTAGEVTEIAGTTISHPSNIGSDYVVYVDDLNNPSSIAGYRNGDKWYNADGTEQANPRLIAQSTSSGRITPYLLNAKDDIRSADFVPSASFVDYTPQVNFMPRIAFSFPISDVAKFFAHYDILTQRPPSRLRNNPLEYYYLASSTGFNNNPNLKPEKTTDYELGFAQELNESRNSKIEITAFYREMRDMIQASAMNYAYPKTYYTFRNIDFGTVKGMSVAYDLRGSNNINLTLNYTLQFADGTGSGSTSAATLVTSDNPNLRSVFALDYDQRHNIVANLDYRFKGGSDYDGPMALKKVLQNVGANLTFRAGSGTPYTQQLTLTNGDVSRGNVYIGGAQKSNIKGNVNGARLPFQSRFDLRLEKNYDIKLGKGEDAKKMNLNMYVQCLNLLNQVNIINVYRFTGSASDDGYLSSDGAQAYAAGQNNQLSFYDLYSIKVNDPSNYSQPRRIRLGLMLDF
ncbi:MAG: TonB-dependent receptor [Bacteroidota bacterium]